MKFNFPKVPPFHKERESHESGFPGRLCLSLKPMQFHSRSRRAVAVLLSVAGLAAPPINGRAVAAKPNRPGYR